MCAREHGRRCAATASVRGVRPRANRVAHHPPTFRPFAPRPERIVGKKKNFFRPTISRCRTVRFCEHASTVKRHSAVVFYTLKYRPTFQLARKTCYRRRFYRRDYYRYDRDVYARDDVPSVTRTTIARLAVVSHRVLLVKIHCGVH